MSKNMGLKIGRSATDQDKRGGGGETWIKGFKDPSTRIRIVQPVTTVIDPETKEVIQQGWHFYYEHFHPELKAFGCTETTDCKGCNDPSEKVRDRNKRYGFNALDEQGRLNVYKCGPSLYKRFKGREQRMDTVMDRDYTILKTGTGLSTEYDYEPGERYPVEVPDEIHDVEALLVTKLIEEVIPAYEGGDLDSSDPEAEADAKDQAAVAAVDGDKPDFEDMGTPEIREWLTEHKVEFPERAQRNTLIKIAKDAPPF